MNSRADLGRYKLLFLFTLLLLALAAVSAVQTHSLRVEWTEGAGVTEDATLESYEQIKIVEAVLLDSNREGVLDIYGSVHALDRAETAPLAAGSYVRVTFEKPLQKNSDISFYARVLSGSPHVDVYEADSTVLLAEFPTVYSQEYSKVLLTKLASPQQTFDLHIREGTLVLNHVYDPPGRLTDDSYTLGAGTIDEGTTTTVTIPYTNSKDPGTWEQVELTETGVDTTLNALTLTCAGDNTGFKVNSIDVSGCATCTDNGDGTIQVTGNPSAASVVWTIEACSSANSDSPYTMANQCTGCTDAVTLNANAALTVNAAAATTTDISLSPSSVAFGSINPSENNDTTDGDPAAFTVQNDGNVKVNITINASDLWSTDGNPTANYKYKVDNGSEGAAFEFGTTQVDYTNMPTTATKGISNLNNTDAADTADVDINITVPGEEPPAAQSSTVFFIATQA